ncbi:MAG TPA: glycosyltransferase family 9 protein [Burkholderiales bacterium]|jgi:tetratricopeptide (TPR) repeat protein|nr:glycosyltransferase family 9 protein [Burkholderiales bacterium]
MLRALLRSLSARPAGAVAPERPAAQPAAPADGPYAAAAEARQRGDAAAAEAIFRAHLAQYPADTDALATFGGALLGEERFDEAAAVLLPALQRFPAVAPLLFNAGSLAQARMQTDEAIRLFRLALAVQPDLAMARFTLSIQLLLKGEYREGLMLLRARNELADPPASGWPRQLPRWEGQSLRGKRLLVWLDWGGLGDELQFARYLPLLARDHQPGALIFVCSEAGRRLYAAIPGVDQALSNPAGIQADYQAALLDLPILCATTLDHMPAAAPYLAPPAADTARWAQRLAEVRGRRIGLCWGSGFWGKATAGDKAIPLELLAPLASLPQTTFISLQKGPARAQLPCPGLAVLDFDAHLHDLADTAALIQNLDVVVSVDTSVAHLAGALGKPVILMLQWESGNFWLLDREDSPWYPSMRIARQASRRDWPSVVCRVLELLASP